MGRNPMRGFGTFGGNMSDDQEDIEQRVLDTMGRTYHCAYCHTIMRQDRCKYCGSTSKVCNSRNSHNKKNYTESGGPR
jgi:hypothetical protein